MGLTLPKNYTRYDSSHIQVCDRFGQLHGHLVPTEAMEKQKQRKERLNYRPKDSKQRERIELSLELGHAGDYLCRLLNRKSLYLSYLRSIDDDICVAMRAYEKEKIQLKKEIVQMLRELNESNSFRKLQLLLVSKKIMKTNQSVKLHFEAIKKGERKSLFQSFITFHKAKQALQTYEEFIK